MRARYVVAAGFVAIVVVLIVVRDQGYLGGRADGGPLTIGAGVAAAERKPDKTAGFGLGPALEGDPVTIQSVRADFTSPGLNFRAARIPPAAGRGCETGCGYPREGELFVESEYDGTGDAVIGLRAMRPGVYYALGLITDYRRGIRRFRSYSGLQLCLAVGRAARCRDVSLPDAELAEIGGPGGPRRLTLTNLSRERIEVSDVTVRGGTVEPDGFGLRPGAGRTVRLKGCDRVEALSARIDGETASVPLSTAVGCDQ